MESLKDPSMIVAMVALLGTIGSSVYSYRHINQLEDQVEDHTETLKKVWAVINDMKQNPAGAKEIGALIGGMQKSLKTQNKTLQEFQDSQTEMEEQVEDLEDQIQKIIEVMVADGKDAKVLVPEPRKRRKSSKKQKKGKGKKVAFKSDDDSDLSDLTEESDEDPSPKRRR